jgi:uncharacterized protein (DUF608 family)
LETGKKSDIIMSYQLDGEWMAMAHGLEGVFRSDRVNTTLETIKRTCIPRSSYGAPVFTKTRTGPPEKGDWNPGYWGFQGVHLPATFMLGMTYMYRGQKEFGLDLARRTVQEVIRRGWYWDWPALIDPGNPALGSRAGFDYYQNMMLWSLPAAIARKDLRAPGAPGGLVGRVLLAAQGGTPRAHPSVLPRQD